ncbi:MAG: hypothetical protein KKB12_02225, partial [Candidatus Omnitrophica bacterium]|nr:hypothetical protein [Candidatus Omnitrophota bacterium]
PHRLDKHIVMSNHVHGIIMIVDSTVEANNYSPLKLQRAKDFSPLHLRHVMGESTGEFQLRVIPAFAGMTKQKTPVHSPITVLNKICLTNGRIALYLIW